MKRLLLTLTVLFMAASAFAECSMYIEDFELKRSELGAKIVVPIKAHFSARVSAWHLSISYPEGLSPTSCQAGSDMTIGYHDSNGEEKMYGVALNVNTGYQTFVAAIMNAGYWQDPNSEDPNAWVSYGAVKWEAGDYDEMILLYLKPGVNFNGGDINISFEPYSSSDTRGGTVADNGDQGQFFYSVCHVTVKDVEEEQTGAPTFSGYDSENGYVVSITPSEDSDIYYRIIKNHNEYGEWSLYTGELLFNEQGYYCIEAYAKAEGKTASDVIAYEFIVQGLPQTDSPVISYSLTNEAVNVTATGAGEVKLYKDGVEVQNPCTIARTTVDQTFIFSATAKEDGKQISELTVIEVVVPAKPTERCLTPSISYGETAVGVVTITIYNGEDGATVYYWIYRDGDLIIENSFVGDSHTFDVSGVGSYTLKAIAKKEGMLDSSEGGIFFMIFQDPLPVLLGDVNGDGMVNITDLNEMLNIIFYDSAFVVEADMNNDGIINVQDVVGLVHYLLNGEIPSISSNGRRAPIAETTGQASLYWQDGVLYLNSDVPVSAMNMINDVDGDITWTLDEYEMVVMQETGASGEHAVIFSFDRNVIPTGVTAIATTSSQAPSVVGAELSTLDSKLISVTLNDQITGLTNIQAAGEINCYMDGSSLVIDNNAIMRDLDITAYAIDGRAVANQHLSHLDSGRTSLEMNDIIKSNRYLILVVRNGRQILATLKLTQNR